MIAGAKEDEFATAEDGRYRNGQGAQRLAGLQRGTMFSEVLLGTCAWLTRAGEQGQQRTGLGWVSLSQVGHLNFDVMSRLPDLML